jgi:hypothetical protein
MIADRSTFFEREAWNKTSFANWKISASRNIPPLCVAACPVHVDARALVAEVARGDFVAASNILKKIEGKIREWRELISARQKLQSKRVALIKLTGI